MGLRQINLQHSNQICLAFDNQLTCEISIQERVCIRLLCPAADADLQRFERLLNHNSQGQSPIWYWHQEQFIVQHQLDLSAVTAIALEQSLQELFFAQQSMDNY